MRYLNQLTRLLNLTWSSWVSHEATRIGAALAFYTLLSLAPLVILSIAVGGLIFGGSVAEQRMIIEVKDLAGPEASRFVQVLSDQAQKPAPNTYASIVGIVTLLLGASGVFVELRSALNTMWDVPLQKTSGIVMIIKDRLLSVGMVLAIGFLLVVSLIVSALLAAAGKFFGGWLPVSIPLLLALNFIISFVGITIMFALVLRYVPDAPVTWREAWVGGTLSAFLFIVGKILIGLYLGRAAIGSIYGSAGSAVVVTVWVYYSAQLFLFAAEFTRVYGECRLHGPARQHT
jgi:membrane protein